MNITEDCRTIQALIISIIRSKNIYRSMSALTSLIRVSLASRPSVSSFFVAVSEIDPFISHAEVGVEALEGSKPEKLYFRALVELAKASALLYTRAYVPKGFAYNVWQRFMKLFRRYKYVTSSHTSNLPNHPTIGIDMENWTSSLPLLKHVAFLFSPYPA